MSALLQLFRRLHTGLASRVRNYWFRSLGMRIDGYAWLHKVDIPRGHSRIHLANGVALDTHVSIICSDGERADTPAVTIGERTYINRHTILDASRSLRVGKDCMIGPFCYLTDHDHRSDGMHAPANSGLIEAPTELEDRVWLGAHVTILKGIRIGHGTVVGAGSVVTKDLPPGVVAVGNPARVIQSSHPRTQRCGDVPLVS